MELPFRNRREAARALGEHLSGYRGRGDVLVLGLPRGGMPVAYELARLLEAPMDLMLVRKIGAPGQRELAMGAIATGGILVLNRDVVEALGVSEAEIQAVVQEELRELRRRQEKYRGDRPDPEIAGRVVVLVDDGLATGATMRAAVAAVRQRHPSKVVVAVPVAPPDTVGLLREEADEVVCVATPEPFLGVGRWYADFTQTSDEEVRELLAQASRRAEEDPMEEREKTESIEVPVRAGNVELPGTLAVPPSARGIVVFAHGSGSSRHSPRNRRVAARLEEGGLATLLFDLLTREEEEVDLQTRELRFDIGLLARRLIEAVDWTTERDEVRSLSVGLFGSSTGAAAALIAAAERPETVRAVVSRGGRPDLAGESLRRVRAPTLFIVGGRDEPVIELHREAAGAMRCEQRTEIIPEASHLFEEPGKLDEVSRLALSWFLEHLTAKD